MTTEEIIAKYKAITPEKVLCILRGDRVVVGEEVGQQNQLFYVIRDPNKDNLYTVESAWNQRIISRSS